MVVIRGFLTCATGCRALVKGAAVLLVAAWGLSSCGEPPQAKPTPLTEDQLRARTEVVYASVDMYKPVAGEQTQLDVYQAPMFYREHPAEQESIDQDLEFARLKLTDGELALDITQPAVYTHEGKVLHGAIDHEQITFLWFRRAGGQGPILAQGLRLTYDSAGFPAIFEVLEDQSGKSLFYASATLEALALERHGPVLQGRTYALEPSRAEAPEALVVRTVKQGAQALGPLVYDGFAGADILQLHCRCAPSQLKAIGNSVEYELIPFGSLDATLIEALTRELKWGDAGKDLGFPASVWPLASLRLPDSF